MAHAEMRVWTGAEPDFGFQVDQARSLLGAPNNPALLPPQFAAAAMINIGGRLVTWSRSGTMVDAAFTLPTPDPSLTVAVQHSTEQLSSTQLTLFDTNQVWPEHGTPLGAETDHWQALEPELDLQIARHM